MIENKKLSLGQDYMAVKCDKHSFSLYKAFKEECEKMGWQYNNSFTPFSEERFDLGQSNCMYFSYHFDHAEGKPSFSFSNTDLNSYSLPEQWYAAKRAVKQMIDERSHLHEIELNSEYTAIVDTKKRVVKVGCQEIPFSRVIEISKLIIELA